METLPRRFHLRGARRLILRSSGNGCFDFSPPNSIHPSRDETSARRLVRGTLIIRTIFIPGSLAVCYFIAFLRFAVNFIRDLFVVGVRLTRTVVFTLRNSRIGMRSVFKALISSSKTFIGLHPSSVRLQCYHNFISADLSLDFGRFLMRYLIQLSVD